MNSNISFSIGDVIEFDIGNYTKVGMIVEMRDAGNECEISVLMCDGRIKKRMLKHDVKEGCISRLYRYSDEDYPVKVWDVWKNSRT